MKRRTDGRFQKSIIDQRTGNRLYFYGKTEKELNQKILQFSREQCAGRLFRTVSDEWWNEIYDTLASQSIRGYENAKKQADAEFGKIPIQQIKPRNVILYLNRFAKQQYAQKTIEHHRMVLNLIFKHAIVENDIDANPCSAIRTPKGSSRKKVTAASPEDELKIQQSADIWLFPFIAIYTGMRKGEILALQWKDILFDENLICVTKSVYHVGDRPYIKQPKTAAGERFVPLLAPLKEELWKRKGSAEAFIISDDGKAPLTNRRYITTMSRYKQQTGITCTAHQMRHSFATNAFEMNLSPKAVQGLLGHKQLSTTMDIYTDFRKRTAIAATQFLNEKLENVKK